MTASLSLASTRRALSHQEVAFILDDDPDLAAGVPPGELQALRDALRAGVISAASPRWTPPEYDRERAFGLLVLDGLLGRRVRVGRGVATELLSCGDILRPWDEPLLWNLVPPELDWRVFSPVRLAVLDERITRIIGTRPQLVVTFSGRLLRRARNGAYLMAVGHSRIVEDRLLATLWHLASNWGRVSREGISIPYRLTHEVLGEIVGAARPSVTLAMQRLRDRGDVRRNPQGLYTVRGDPPWSDPVDGSA